MDTSFRRESIQLVKERIDHYKFLIKDYEDVKAKKHAKYSKAHDFYVAHNLNRKTFLKYYHRFKNDGIDTNLLPRKRGPRYSTRYPIKFIENKVIKLRELGNNRYGIVDALRPILKGKTPSPSGVYNILKRNNLNRLNKPMKQNKRKIIKEYQGQLGHIDCHYLSKNLIRGEAPTKRYLVAVLDDYTRVCWAEVIEDLTSLTVMFATMRLFMMQKELFGIQYEEILSDNGSEFGMKKHSNIMTHPFKRMCHELGIKHRHTRPYRPQTNGKVERFWRTLNEDLIQDTDFDSIEEFKEELLNYLNYYNFERSHQGIKNQKPAQMTESYDNNKQAI